MRIVVGGAVGTVLVIGEFKLTAGRGRCGIGLDILLTNPTVEYVL